MMNAIRYAAVSWLALTMACTGSVGDTPGQQGGTAAGPGSGSSGNGNGNGSGAGAGQGVSGNGPDGTPGAGAGNGTAGAAATPAGEIGLHGMPIHTRFVRLTHDQWELSVRDLLKLDAVPGVSSSFASDPPDGTFSNNERALFVTSTLRNDYQRAAETLSEQVARNATALARVTGGSMDSAAFIRSFGRRAYRRPLTTVEEQRYQALFTSGATVFKSGNAFADGAQLFIEAVLQSPHFLFRSELGADGAPLSGYEVASKLSFLLRNTMPDDALLSAAQAGELDTPAGIEARARQLLDGAEVEKAVGRFHSELFGLDRYEAINKDTTLFRSYTEALNAEFRVADDRFLSRIYRQGLGLREILTSTLGDVNAALAPLYGVTAPSSGWAELDLGAQRPGLFTRLGFLALNASMRHPDPIHRGVDLNHRLLCAPLAPPPGTIPALPEPMSGQTNRERVNAHTGPGTCGSSCHGTIINPVGFAFENFDAMGQLRTTDNGKPVDTTGEYAFLDGLRGFKDAPELLGIIAEHPQAHACYAAHLAEYGLSRDLAEPDRALVSGLRSASLTPNSSVKQILLAVITSPAFRTRSGGMP